MLILIDLGTKSNALQNTYLSWKRPWHSINPLLVFPDHCIRVLTCYLISNSVPQYFHYSYSNMCNMCGNKAHCPAKHVARVQKEHGARLQLIVFLDCAEMNICCIPRTLVHVIACYIIDPVKLNLWKVEQSIWFHQKIFFWDWSNEDPVFDTPFWTCLFWSPTSLI